MEGKGKRLRFYTIKYINFSYYSQGYFCLLLDINTGMNRLGNCYASTNYILSIYYSLTKQKTSEAKRFDVNECIGRTWVVINIRTSGFSVFGVLELAHTAESAAKKKTYDFNFDSHYKSLSFQYIRFTSPLIGALPLYCV